MDDLVEAHAVLDLDDALECEKARVEARELSKHDSTS